MIKISKFVSICCNCFYQGRCEFESNDKSICMKYESKEKKMKKKNWWQVIWDGVGLASKWLSRVFKKCFLNIPAVIAWIAVGLIFLLINKLSALFTLNTLTLYALIFILVLAVKIDSKD